MILYNTTFVIDNSCKDDFLMYLRETYVPVVIDREVLRNASLHRVIGGDPNTETCSYALQFRVEDPSLLQDFLSTCEMASLQQDMIERFGDQLTGFITLLEEQAL